MFTVTTPAVSTSILTLSEIKTRLGVASDDTSRDSELTDLGNRVSDLIAAECRVPGDGINPPTLLRETITETFRLGEATPVLRLARRPIVSITSVVEDGVTLAASDYEIENAPAFLHRLSDDDERSYWPASKIVIVYVAGWQTALLRSAALMVLSEINAAESRDPLLRSESVEGVGQMTYWTGGLDSGNGSVMSNQAAASLDPFRYHAV